MQAPAPPAVQKDSAASLDPSSPTQNRFQADLDKFKKNAAFGAYAPDMIKALSGGQTDYDRDILLSIRRQYFTMTQFIQGIYWALSIGMLIATLALGIVTPGLFPDLLSANAGMIWGVFLLSFGISSLVSESGAHTGIRKCTTEKYKDPKDPKAKEYDGYKVDEEHRGQECLTDGDCSIKPASQIPPGVCAHPKMGSFSKLMRHLITPIALVVGIILTTLTFTATSYRLPGKDLAQSIIYGIGIGTVFAIMFS